MTGSRRSSLTSAATRSSSASASFPIHTHRECGVAGRGGRARGFCQPPLDLPDASQQLPDASQQLPAPLWISDPSARSLRPSDTLIRPHRNHRRSLRTTGMRNLSNGRRAAEKKKSFFILCKDVSSVSGVVGDVFLSDLNI